MRVITMIKKYYKNLYNIKLIENIARREILNYIINKILLKAIKNLLIFISI